VIDVGLADVPSLPCRFTNDATRQGKNAQLADACLVIDALGDDAK